VATIEKRGDGWRVRVRRPGVDRSKTLPTKALARAWGDNLERELDEIDAGRLPRKTLREALERYRDEVSPTKRGERWEVVRIRAWLGTPNEAGERPRAALSFVDMPLASLDTPTLAAWRNERSKAVSPASVLREMALMNAVLAVARQEWKWIRVNPLKDVKRPERPESRRRRIAPAELDALLQALDWDGRRVEFTRQQVAAALLLAIETAMRQGEILGLTWDRIDRTRRVAHLPRTKNGSAREVPLSQRALEILDLLQGLHAHQVFTLTSASCDALFRRARDRSMIADLHFHDSRREGTSRLAKKVDVLTLAKITGHKDLNMLMVYYETDMSEVAASLG
jgi:integrase